MVFMVISLCDRFVWDEIQDLSSVVRPREWYILGHFCASDWFWCISFIIDCKRVIMLTWESLVRVRDFDNINNVKWQFFNLRDYPQGIPSLRPDFWSTCDVGESQWGESQWGSWVEILSSILRRRPVPASSKGIREFESHRRWPGILFFTTGRITFLKALPGVRCMMCWQGSPHGHPPHVHPMVAVVAHRAWRYFVWDLLFV